MSILKETNDVLALAKAAQAAEGEEFVTKVDLYLNAFDAWQKKVEKNSSLLPKEGSELESFRGVVQQLNAVHQTIISQANDEKESVANELGALHKRAQGLKSYVDRFPKRISITGKRKG